MADRETAGGIPCDAIIAAALAQAYADADCRRVLQLLREMGTTHREAVLRAAAKAAGLRVLTEAQARFAIEYSDDCLGEIVRQGAYVGGHSDYAETVRERAQKAADVLAALRGEEVPQP